MWTLTHSVSCRADVTFAWRFWTDVENWVVDPAVDTVSVEPGFVPGGRGTTVTRDGARTQWHIREIMPLGHARLEIPAPGAALHITWTFEPRNGGGSVLRQEMSLTGERAAEYEQELAPVLDTSVPAGMQRLATAIDTAYDNEQQSGSGA